jgi:hypothetical protein
MISCFQVLTFVPMPPAIHLLIYEDDNDLREGLGQYLAASGEFQFMGFFTVKWI